MLGLGNTATAVAAAAICLALGGLAGCGGGNAQGGGAATPAGGGDQVAQGQQLFGAKCATCHGAHGNDGKAPPLVGPNALPLDPPATAKFRKTQFHTAKDVYDFVKANMPPDAAGTLSDDETAAIIAFDLKANGVDLGGKKVDATTASSFVLHP